MLAIKFQRVGKKHQPSYRIVVAEKRSKLGGPPVEQVGTYNPSTKKASLEKERVLYWLKVGAKPTASIHNLLVRQSVISGPKVAIKTKKPEMAPVASDSSTGIAGEAGATVPPAVGQDPAPVPQEAVAEQMPAVAERAPAESAEKPEAADAATGQ